MDDPGSDTVLDDMDADDNIECEYDIICMTHDEPYPCSKDMDKRKLTITEVN
jgi:hypothetical protein